MIRGILRQVSFLKEIRDRYAVRVCVPLLTFESIGRFSQKFVLFETLLSGWCCHKAVDSYSRNAPFESRPRYWLLFLIFLKIFLVPSRQMANRTSTRSRSFASIFFPFHPSSYNATFLPISHMDRYPE
jgi:hypothetical protein